MRTLLSLLPLLLLLLSRPGSAYEAWGSGPRARLSLSVEDSASAAMPQGLRFAPGSAELAKEAEDPFARRVVREAILGTLSSGVGVLGGAVVGFAVADSTSCGIDDCLQGLAITGVGIVTGVVLLAPVGVYWGGRWAEGQGSFLATLGGSALGGGLAALAVAAMGDSVGGVGALSMVLSPLVGSIIGYELSHASMKRSGGSRRLTAGGVRLVPTVGVTRAGTGVLGLAGRF